MYSPIKTKKTEGLMVTTLVFFYSTLLRDSRREKPTKINMLITMERDGKVLQKVKDQYLEM